MDRSTLKRHGLGKSWLQSGRVQLPPSLKSFRAPFLVAIAYYLGAQAAFSIGTLSDRIFAPFWPPNIILFCALLLVPKRQWWLYIAAAFPAHVLAEIDGRRCRQRSLWWHLGPTAWWRYLSAFGVRRFLTEPPWFGTLRNAAIYILITAGVSPAISALGGAFVQILGGGPLANYWTYWGNWYMANALGSCNARTGVLDLVQSASGGFALHVPSQDRRYYPGRKSCRGLRNCFSCRRGNGQYRIPAGASLLTAPAHTLGRNPFRRTRRERGDPRSDGGFNLAEPS